MEFFNKTQQSQRGLERFIVIIFTLYNLNFCAGMIRNEKEIWIIGFLLADLVAVWIVYMGKYRNFRIRAIFVSVLIQFAAVLYGANIDDPSDMAPSFIVLCVLVALYGFSDLLFLTLVSAAFTIFYHAVIVESFNAAPGEMIGLIARLGNIFCVEFVLYVWLKKRNEVNGEMYKVIDALIEAEQSKDDFLSNVSHEIRTPVNTICGMSEMALREHDAEKMRDEIFDIRDAGHNLMSLVSDILDFSQLQQGKMNLEEEAYNITSTINDIINIAMARRGDKPIELIVDCDSNIPSGLLGDEKKIRRVIMNLVDNAIKFTDEGGIIIDIHARKEDYGINLCVAVKDTGIGIGEEALEKLFESFSQVDTRRNRQKGGVGLGLAISKELVQKMGGTITVQSRLGKGSVFRFVVPQKVLDEKPIGQVEHREKINIAAYFDMEQFDMMTIRDEYSRLIRHMIMQLRVRCHVCRNLAELKRREEIDEFTHVFISLEEYQEDEEFFNELAKKAQVAMVIERYNEKYVSNPDIIRLYKPFFILPIVSILNGSRVSEGGKQIVRPGKFIAPDAHVLVVDDNRMNIRVVEGLLKEYQIKVTYATSGREALEIIEKMNYDFVFMDHMMPEMDGIEAMHRIREKVGHYYQTVPIIALTANAAPGNREMFLEEGFTDFVEKPLEVSVLERVLRRNLPEEKLIFHKAGAAGRLEEAESVRITAEAADNGASGADMPDFAVGDLDTDKGMLYCGSKAAYIEVLEACYVEGAEERRLIADLFENKDWKNYVIKVHALKSTMKSIGAETLFEKARKLEAAGRNDDIDYILQNHDDMLAEHRRVMKELAKLPFLREKLEDTGNADDVEAVEDTAILEDEAFDKLLNELEDAAYSLDAAAMFNILSELCKHNYCGAVLKEKLAPVKKKIEKSDYMSAFDTVSKLRESLKAKNKEAPQND